MSNLKEAVAYIETHNLMGIKAGTERTTFLDIWMVVVDNRIFARSWGFAEKSWYNTFLQNEYGQIKCGDNVFDVIATPIHNQPELHEKINLAYLQKYNSPENLKYAEGIIEPQHVEKTMEFRLREK